MERKYIIDYPNLIKEWHFDKNDKLGLYPNKLTYGSTKKVWWKCSKCKYEWLTSPNHRSRGTGCPLCSNRVVLKGKNDLETLYPEIAKRWHPTLNTLKASEVTPHSNKKAYWFCEKDSRHYFLTRIEHMIDANIACPVCANQSIILGINDLVTTNPELIKEWDFKKNKTIRPEECTYGNSRKVWWKCEKGHSWCAAISSRTTQKTGCPICSKELRVSFAESAISYYLSKFFGVENSKHFDWLKSKEIDIYLPDLLLGVEYDGGKWHQDIKRDIQKDILCYNKGIRLIRIREPNCPVYETTAKLIFLEEKGDYDCLDKAISDIFDYIEEIFHFSNKISINVQRDYDEILKLHITTEKAKCITNKKLIEEWNYEKNSPLLPSMFKNGSTKKVWWKCSLGHEWKAVIYSRTSGEKCGCPYCAGQKVITGWNDLQTLYPQIAQEWDFEKNGEVTPNKIRPQTNKAYGWVCIKCNFRWTATVSHRVCGRGCPKCGRERTIQSLKKPVVNLDTGIQYESAVEAGKALNIHPGCIRLCCKGKIKIAGGYHWAYVNRSL